MDRLWVDKHRPQNFKDLDYHDDISQVLSKLAHQDDFPHLLFYGQNGAGKKTRIMAFLQEIYGKGVHLLKSELKDFQVTKGSSTVAECNITSSNFHLDITPSDAEHHDKVVIQKLIKEVAQNHQLDCKTQRNYKVIVINEVDRTTKEAQAGLRRTMEKYVSQCRLILTCENLGRVIQPLRSRCLLIRVSAPKLKAIRDKFYDLLVNCIPGEFIFKELMYELMELCDKNFDKNPNICLKLKQDIIQKIAEYECQMQLGQKQIFHLEACTAHIMALIKGGMEQKQKQK